MATVEIDPGAGFCFGVEKVIEMAESRLRRGETVYGLGELVHNREEMERLHALGLVTLTHSDLAGIGPGHLLFRAHGEPPATYELAAAHHVEVIDGTCPIVLKLQERIRNTYSSMDHRKEQVVIFGKPDHPETIGLLGQVGGDAVVVTSPEEIVRVDRDRAVHLFSQTTMDPDLFRKVENALRDYLAVKKGGTGPAFRSSCTICSQMKKRKPGLAAFAQRHDVIVFVSGKNSSNGKMLFEYCRSLNRRSHWISGPGEIEGKWFRGAGSIGISGATSTSKEQLESVSNHVNKILSS
jgi:4-hydroxy-3-methylbut-2-enyl diphosphate reductase